MSGNESGNIRVWLRFYGELNDLLSRERRGMTFQRTLPETTSVKDLIEGCGIPHTEVDVILADNRPVDFSFMIRGSERVSVYPFFNTIDLPESVRLQGRGWIPPRFVADVNLGKLARFLRMAGFDSAYRNDANDKEIIGQMTEEDRIVLTRDRRLLMHKVVKKGYLVRSGRAVEQLEEVLHRFNLYGEIRSFSRCIHCNGLLEKVDKSEVLDQLEPLTKRYFDRFARCTECDHIYWPGSHRDRLDPKLQKILELE